jgi:transcriptional regulator with XRE-family HTH domain
MPTAPTPEEAEHWRAFGRWLHATRTAARIPRRTLARAAGICDSSLANYERGGRHQDHAWWVQRPTHPTLAALARALDVPLDEMCRRAGPGLRDAPAPPAPPAPVPDLAALLDAFAALTAEVARLAAALAPAP